MSLFIPLLDIQKSIDPVTTSADILNIVPIFSNYRTTSQYEIKSVGRYKYTPHSLMFHLKLTNVTKNCYVFLNKSDILMINPDLYRRVKDDSTVGRCSICKGSHTNCPFKSFYELF
jgi:hypothetical protein